MAFNQFTDGFIAIRHVEGQALRCSARDGDILGIRIKRYVVRRVCRKIKNPRPPGWIQNLKFKLVTAIQLSAF